MIKLKDENLKFTGDPISKKALYIIAAVLVVIALSLFSFALLAAESSPSKKATQLTVNGITVITDESGIIDYSFDSEEIVFGDTFIVHEENIHFRTGGSGSCPPIIENVSFTENVVSIEVKDTGEICTADYRNYDFKIMLRGEGFPEDVKVEVSRNDSIYTVIEKNELREKGDGPSKLSDLDLTEES